VQPRRVRPSADPTRTPVDMTQAPAVRLVSDESPYAGPRCQASLRSAPALSWRASAVAAGSGTPRGVRSRDRCGGPDQPTVGDTEVTPSSEGGSGAPLAAPG